MSNNGHGGKRLNSGRKSKDEERKLAERLTPYQDEAINALGDAINGLPWAIKLFFEYMYGKPTQRVDNKHEIKHRKIANRPSWMKIN